MIVTNIISYLKAILNKKKRPNYIYYDSFTLQATLKRQTVKTNCEWELGEEARGEEHAHHHTHCHRGYLQARTVLHHCSYRKCSFCCS